MELQRAYDVLTDEQKRAQYDRWLEGGAMIPFDTWMSIHSTHSVRILPQTIIKIMAETYILHK